MNIVAADLEIKGGKRAGLAPIDDMFDDGRQLRPRNSGTNIYPGGF
jgi:COP9 signalosome complex subunit 1